ncbi:unnamed protein product [Rhizophagus irregularis]|nr:unnamed protein product [Rhizophagus irregularis]CAB4428546.1 unnamed protein product [Rhizophagus irregularis]
MKFTQNKSLFPNTRARPFSLENDKQTIFSISSIPTSMFSISVFLYFTKGVHSRINRKLDHKLIFGSFSTIPGRSNNDARHSFHLL